MSAEERLLLLEQENINLKQKVEYYENLFYLKNYSDSNLINSFHTRTTISKILQLFKFLYSESNDQIVIFRVNNNFLPGNYIDANKEALRQKGYNLEELIKLSPLVTGNTPIEIFQERIRKTYENGHFTYETFTTTNDKQISLYEVHYYLIEFDSKKAILAIKRDITEKRKTQEELILNLERWRFLAKYAPEIILYTDTNGIIQFINHTIPEIPANEITGKSFYILFPENEHETIKEFFTEAIEQEKVVTFEIKSNDKNWYLVKLGPAKINQQITGVTVLLNDITDRKKDEIKLIEREEMFRTITEAAHDAIIMIDYSGRITLWNPAAEKMFGYSSEHTLGQEMHSLLINDSEMKDIYLKYFDFWQKTGKLHFNQHTFELETKRSDNTQIIVEISISTLHRNNQFYGIAIIRDITERKIAEKKLKEYTQELHELNATKDKFFSIIAHDLKAPFHSILGFTELLSKNINSYQTQKIELFVKLIYDSACQTFSLLENLLTWSRTQRGKINFNPEEINLELLIFDAISNLQTVALSKNIEIVHEIERSHTIIGDKEMIATIIRNLLSNAIKFSNSESKVIVQVHESNKYVEISVIDHGVGMPDDIKDNLFRIDINTTTHGTAGEKGSGLGLLLCKEFIDMHKGKMIINSAFGKGSEFIVTIPKNYKNEL